MKKIVIMLLIVVCAKLGFSQKDSLRYNSVYAELGGTGAYYSLGYERDFTLKNKWGLSIGAGAAIIKNDYTWVTLPILVKINYKLNKHKFECGIGLTPSYYRYTYDYASNHQIEIYSMYIFAQLGYKYDFFNNRCYIGISFTPAISQIYSLATGDNDHFFYPWGGLRIGYKF